jgi:hypothetical protein
MSIVAAVVVMFLSCPVAARDALTMIRALPGSWMRHSERLAQNRPSRRSTAIGIP